MIFHNSIVLITGGTGMLGYSLVRQLLPQNPAKIIIYSRNEANQVAMSRVFDDPRLSFSIGDVRDKDALSKACETVDYVFHLAELNDAALCENQLDEAIKTNIAGPLNLIKAAAAAGVKKVVYWSAGEAATPSSLYGLTKAIAEKLIVHANTYSSSAAFVCVRSGTIFEARPSAVRSVPDYSSDASVQYFLTVREAARHLLKAASIGKGGEVLLTVMPLYRTDDLIEAITGEAGKPRSGVTIEEIIFSEYERSNTVVYDEDFWVILPDIIPELLTVYASCPPLSDISHRLGSPFLSIEQLRELLEANGLR